ncbi:MAG: PaaI family thioesterase, partial [Candidatus Deferrimicrobiaceae bacterium]
GWCESALEVLPKHLQQDGYVHAGVQATMADHTAGGAACTLAAEEELVLTVEFKINFLRPARGERLRCRAAVLRQGRTLNVAESEVYAQRDGSEKLVAKAMVTLALVPAAPIPSSHGRGT